MRLRPHRAATATQHSPPPHWQQPAMQQVAPAMQRSCGHASAVPRAPAPRLMRVQQRRLAVCAAQRDQASDAAPALHRAAMGAVAVAAAASLALAPLEAQAVSGGGGVSAQMSYQDFSGQDLKSKKMSFTKAIIRKTNFSNCNLAGLSFFGAVAPETNFHGADLSMAVLDGADFEGSDFSDAILTAAYVANTQFKGANITGADFTDVDMRPDQQRFLCTIAKGVNPKTGVDTRESLNCE